MTIDIVLIGNGSWGKNYIKTCLKFPDINLIVATKENWKLLIDNGPKGAIIATRPDSHVEIAKYCLERNIPTLIEKPLSFSLKEAEQLKPFNHNILVNHIHLFSDAYENIKRTIKNSNIIEINTVGIGPISRPYSNLFDYGIHEVAIVLDLVKSYPKEIVCKNIILENANFYKIQMVFDNTFTECITGVHIRKEKSLFIRTDEFNISYNDLNKSNKNLTPLEKVISVLYRHIVGCALDARMGINLSLNALAVLETCENSLK